MLVSLISNSHIYNKSLKKTWKERHSNLQLFSGWPIQTKTCSDLPLIFCQKSGMYFCEFIHCYSWIITCFSLLYIISEYFSFWLFMLVDLRFSKNSINHVGNGLSWGPWGQKLCRQKTLNLLVHVWNSLKQF